MRDLEISIIKYFNLFRYRKGFMITEDGYKYSYLHIGFFLITFYSGFDYEIYLEYINDSPKQLFERKELK